MQDIIKISIPIAFAFRNAVWSTAIHHGVGGATNKTTASLPSYKRCYRASSG